MSEALKILCVDDESDMEYLIRQKFRKEIRNGIYNFYFAQNGVEAIKVLNEFSDIYLVLSDINMPVMDGLRLLDEIKMMENPFVKVVMVSAYGDMHNIRKAMNLGAFDFINKPIDFDDFIVTIEKSKQEIERLQIQSNTAKTLKAVENDLLAAAKIQSSLLPVLSGVFNDNKQLKVSSYIKPARWGGGDFYDVFEIEKNKIGFIIADVSGKGIPAAVFMFLSRTTLRIFSSLKQKPSEVLFDANNYLNIDNDSSMFVTVFYGILDLTDHVFTYSNAGHNPPYLIKDSSATALKTTENMALGVMPNLPYKDISIPFQSGNKLFMFTDGVSECMNEAFEEFNESRIVDVLNNNHKLKVEDITKKMKLALADFQGQAEQHDDITTLSFEME